MTADDKDGVQSVIEELGLHGAMQYAKTRLAQLELESPRIRQQLINIINVTAKRMSTDIVIARRLARCHAQGLKQWHSARKAKR